MNLSIHIPINVIQQGNASSQQDQQSSHDQLQFTAETKKMIMGYAMQVLERELGNTGMITEKMRGM